MSAAAYKVNSNYNINLTVDLAVDLPVDPTVDLTVERLHCPYCFVNKRL